MEEQLVGTGRVSRALIAGRDGAIWAASNEFPVSQDEMRRIAAEFENKETLAMTGLVVAGTK